MTEFEPLWQFVMKRTERGVMTVQQREELEHVYNLMKGCDCQSYLEVGTAEGNSLYVLGHVARRCITYIDLGEAHTLAPRRQVVSELESYFTKEELDVPIISVIADSAGPNQVNECRFQYDCVLIDGGHDFATVLSDSILYAPLATKYIFWHDIQLPEVKAAVEWFVKRWKLGKYSTFINSEHFGYGIVEVGK